MPRRQERLSFFTDADRIAAVEQALQAVENEGKTRIDLPTYVVRALAGLAKRARRAGPGKTPLSQQLRNHDLGTVAYAARRKRELTRDGQSQGKPIRASEAATRGAEEAKTSRGSRLSVGEIVSRINRPRGRYRLMTDLIEQPEAWIEEEVERPAQRAGTKGRK